jgi:hypothetical protein
MADEADDRPMIEFDQAKTRRLRDAYEAAVASQQQTFMFDGQEYVIGFAFYLLEYLASKFQNGTLAARSRPDGASNA